ncbi:MAG: divergent polysaccharide deacetylase family protein [Candidatus Omnitrophota bacterium]
MLRLTFYKLVIGFLLLVIIIMAVFISVSRPKKAPPVQIPKVKWKIAIVIDDWGYTLKNMPIMDNIKYPLTAAVLPNLPYSSRVAKELYERGFEVILHLPMEPKEKYALEKNTILISMGEETIKKIIAEALSSVSYAKGVSNHQGSRATEDPRIMEVVFRELKKRRLYYLDSFVSRNSACTDLAHKMHLPIAKRDIFLDNFEDPVYIKLQMKKLKNKARMHGEAIGIGHDRKNTLKVISEVMPQLEKEGYRFVFLSELER